MKRDRSNDDKVLKHSGADRRTRLNAAAKKAAEQKQTEQQGKPKPK